MALSLASHLDHRQLSSRKFACVSVALRCRGVPQFSSLRRTRKCSGFVSGKLEVNRKAGGGFEFGVKVPRLVRIVGGRFELGRSVEDGDGDASFSRFGESSDGVKRRWDSFEEKLAAAWSAAYLWVVPAAIVVSLMSEPLDAAAAAVLVPRKLQGDELATVELFQDNTPSVVYITNLAFRRRDVFTLDVMQVPQGSGSGFVWDKKGHIVTNYHVIRGASDLRVTMGDQTVYEADIVGYDEDKDVAVLHIDAPEEELRPLPVGTSYDLLVGQKVFAIGNPFGLDHTLTTGVISGLRREISSAATGRPIQDVIQTDAAINPGNSGGPLLDSGGNLIGINTAIYSPSGASSGVGFSIPVDTVYYTPFLCRRLSSIFSGSSTYRGSESSFFMLKGDV
uniref:Protease Do-like 1, chloroplastic n=1 Tax=Physcomitrium patens TaxID=3218 RepID=A0A7I4DDH8_PHYPA